MVPLVGSVYPVPAWPVNIFPYIFLGYLLLGMAWFAVLRRRPLYWPKGFTSRLRPSTSFPQTSYACRSNGPNTGSPEKTLLSSDGPQR
jgi:hypothetical protein